MSKLCSGPVFIVGDRPATEEHVRQKLKSEGDSNIRIVRQGGYFEAIGSRTGKPVGFWSTRKPDSLPAGMKPVNVKTTTISFNNTEKALGSRRGDRANPLQITIRRLAYPAGLAFLVLRPAAPSIAAAAMHNSR